MDFSSFLDGLKQVTDIGIGAVTANANSQAQKARAQADAKTAEANALAARYASGLSGTILKVALFGGLAFMAMALGKELLRFKKAA